MAPQIGRLDERITIQKDTPTRDSAGAQVPSWSTLATVWAKVDAAAAVERRVDDQVSAMVSYTVIIRYRSDVTPDMRISWSGRTLEIIGVLETDGRRRWTQLSCVEAAT